MTSTLAPVNLPFFLFVMNRLSSIDTKYHTWKLGVVLTDNVRLIRHIFWAKTVHFVAICFLISIFSASIRNLKVSTCVLLKRISLDNLGCFFVFLLQNFLYLIWYTTMSIFGHFNNFFFAAHLLDIAMGFKTLRTILSSVTHNGKQVSLSASRGRQSVGEKKHNHSN